MRVGEEDVPAVEKLWGDFRGALGQNIQIDFDGDGFIQIFHVRAVPAESFAPLADFQAGGVDVSALENREEVFGSIFADDADQTHGREERGGPGEVDSRAADYVVALAVRRFDGVDADGAGD